ncbi:MAG TPA: phosphatase PAP2 family protein [Verrucomicrobiae bacterium]|nr:phosphatase PAP2 family protein [Verrucomicrobiae bacterium]
MISVLAFLAGTKADVITDWNTVMLNAIRNESTAPPLASRNLAIMHAAIHDAVNAITPAHKQYLVRVSAPGDSSAEAAAVGAAYKCLTELFPSQNATFDDALDQFLVNNPPSQNRDDGLMVGEMTALLILGWRSNDGASTSVPYIPSSEPGAWRRTPPFFRPPELPQWPYVVPFAMTSGAQFRPPGPPALDSERYAADVNQVKQLGAVNSTNRTGEQTLIARFWSDFSFTVTPPGHWNQIAQNIVTNRPSNLMDNARLFALLNIAMADAAICVWDAKYVYNLWRPVTAIQQADTDGNPATEADPDWIPLLNTPAFPEYVSGHSAFSAAAAAVLTLFYGADNVGFTVGSDSVPGLTRTYNSLAACAEEIALSRIYGGIHFYSADVDGLEAGQHIGEYVVDGFLRPISQPAQLFIAAHKEISVNGTFGNKYVVETSTNLVEWAPLLTNAVPFTFLPSAETATAFYRAVAAE